MPSDEQPAKRPRPPSAAPPIDFDVEPHSGIRIKPTARRLSRSDMQSLVATFEVRKLRDVPHSLRSPSAATASAWLTIGVLVDKGPAKPTQRGDSFCVWKLSDLRAGGVPTTISVFLFGEAFSSAWKELPGAVFALLGAKPVPPKEGSSDGDVAVSIEKQQQLQRIGQVCPRTWLPPACASLPRVRLPFNRSAPSARTLL